ncbi:MAG: zinc-binding alcohol dehydrogenase family protein, partial [Candidatus Promineifilaceae bacterium]|nr:zinc-binding alcohol dehydrogenase family protein [Candidatus Promineifilaceae bacterium]
MKAMRLHATQPIDEAPLTHEDAPQLTPGVGQMRLRVHMCGVCHTDLHTVEGDLDLPKLPITPGHQVVATVEALGPGVSAHRPGDRVGVAWLHWTCGECQYCTSGQENICPNARFTGLHADGGYAQMMIVHQDFAYPIPDDFTDQEAAPLLCAGIVGFRALRLSNVSRGGKLGLYGFGASAHLVIQVARHWQCDVYVFTRNENHRRLARRLGAAWVGGAEDDCPVELDGSINFAPAGYIIPLALGHLRPGGTLAINAIHMSP